MKKNVLCAMLLMAQVVLGSGLGLELVEEDDTETKQVTTVTTLSTPASTPTQTPAPVQEQEEEELVLDLNPTPAPAPAPKPASKTASKPASKPAPQPAFTPEPESEPMLLTEPEPEPVYTPTPTPEPVYLPEPEPEPVYVPEPEPEPVYTPAPMQQEATIIEPEPVKETQKETYKEPVKEPAPVAQPKKEVVFKVSKNFLEFKEQGGEASVEITSAETWKVVENPSWVTTLRKNNILTIKAARNEHFSDREGDVVLSNNRTQLIVVVAQGRNTDYIKLSAQLIDDTEGDGGRYTIKVSSNKAWKTNELPAWCTAEANGENLSIRLAVNKTGAARQTQIEVYMPQSAAPKQIITVKQSPIHDYITINPNIITSSGKSSIATVTVETDKYDYWIEGLPAWCTVKQKTAKSFTLEIADNSGGAAREAQCRVTIGGDKSENLVIKQEDRLTYVMVSPKIITASKRGGIITVNVKSSGAWRVVNLPDWCEVTATTDNTFTLSIAENKTNNPRRATFSVSTGGVRESIEIKQE